MKERSVTFYQNPKVEVLFGFILNLPIPTKQDQFKPVTLTAVNEDTGEEIEVKNFYEKKGDKSSIHKMKNIIADLAQKAFVEKGIIKKPSLVEVVLSISVGEKRFKQVDIDNLSKTVLDGLTGSAFEDDSQVSSLIATKHVHPKTTDAIMIGVTELTENRQGFMGDIFLWSEKPWEK